MDNRLDNILENSLRESLLEKPHNDFTKNLMLKVSLEEEFAKQDVKTDKAAKKIIIGITSVFLVLVAFISYVIYITPSENENAGEFAEKTGSFFEITGIKFMNIFGMTGLNSLYLLLTIGVIATVFFTIDKFIFKKKMNRI